VWLRRTERISNEDQTLEAAGSTLLNACLSSLPLNKKIFLLSLRKRKEDF
jgi:hypothetical protein